MIYLASASQMSSFAHGVRITEVEAKQSPETVTETKISITEIKKLYHTPGVMAEINETFKDLRVQGWFPSFAH